MLVDYYNKTIIFSFSTVVFTNSGHDEHEWDICKCHCQWCKEAGKHKKVVPQNIVGIRMRSKEALGDAMTILDQVWKANGQTSAVLMIDDP